MVGDRWVDIGAADAAGVRSVLIERDYSWLPTSAGAPPDSLRPTLCARALPEAARAIVADQS
jgi:phosphoglycolate phosphatase-like HAD superfamily hydrolase